MKANLSHSGCSIVLLGNFAPLTFLPDWFGRREIIPESEAGEAALEIAHPDYLSFNLAWLKLTVEPGRFTAITGQEPAIRVHDLIVSTFSLLADTPIFALGLNRHLHYQCETVDAWHLVGDRLAPKEPWGEFAMDGGVRRAGLRSLLFERGRIGEEPRGAIQVRVEPSAMVRNGIYFDVNDHYDLTNETKQADGATAVQVVSNRWSGMFDLTSGIVERLLRD